MFFDKYLLFVFNQEASIKPKQLLKYLNKMITLIMSGTLKMGTRFLMNFYKFTGLKILANK